MDPIDTAKQEENLDAAEYWRQEEDRRAKERWDEAEEDRQQWEAMVRFFRGEEE